MNKWEDHLLLPNQKLFYASLEKHIVLWVNLGATELPIRRVALNHCLAQGIACNRTIQFMFPENKFQALSPGMQMGIILPSKDYAEYVSVNKNIKWIWNLY